MTLRAHALHLFRRAACRWLAGATCALLGVMGHAQDSPGAEDTAADPEGASWSIKGFGTLGAVYHNSAGVNFRRNISQAQGAQAGRVSLAPDSMLGLQASAQWSPQWQGAVQLISQDSVADGYRPGVSWAYVRHSPRENVAMRLGRLGIEMYLQGDAAHVGYSSLAVRQPTTFYPDTLDGVDVEMTHPLGPGTVRVKGAFGWVHGTLSSGFNPYIADGSRFAMLLTDYVSGSWTTRFSLGRMKMRNESSTPELDAFRANLLAQAPNGQEIVNRTLMKGRHLDYVAASLAYDSGPLQGALNVVHWWSSGWVTNWAWYGHLGYRMGAFTPYLTFHHARAPRDTLATGIPQGLSTLTDQFNDAAALVQSAGRVNQSSLGMGMRYELTRSSALKVQWDHIRYQDTDVISDVAQSAVPFGQRGRRSLNLLSVAWEFVF